MGGERKVADESGFVVQRRGVWCEIDWFEGRLSADCHC